MKSSAAEKLLAPTLSAHVKVRTVSKARIGVGLRVRSICDKELEVELQNGTIVTSTGQGVDVQRALGERRKMLDP